MRTFLLYLCLACLASSLRAGEEDFTPLLNKELTGWKVVPESTKESFSVKELDGELVLFVTGKKLAYLHTEKKYGDYTLRYEWKAPEEGRSGVLLHIAEPHKVWPRCVQAQAQQHSNGRLFTMGGAEGNFTRDKKAQRTAVKPDEWNTTEIVSRDGKLTVKINGVEVSSGTSDLTEGFIGLQAEGTGFSFKGIRIKEK